MSRLQCRNRFARLIPFIVPRRSLLHHISHRSIARALRALPAGLLPEAVSPLADAAPSTSQAVSDTLSLHAFRMLGELADASAAVSAADSASGGAAAPAKSSDWISPISDNLEIVLKLIQDKLDVLHVPYSYGWSIVLLTLFVKIITTPLTKKQVSARLALSMYLLLAACICLAYFPL